MIKKYNINLLLQTIVKYQSRGKTTNVAPPFSSITSFILAELYVNVVGRSYKIPCFHLASYHYISLNFKLYVVYSIKEKILIINIV